MRATVHVDGHLMLRDGTHEIEVTAKDSRLHAEIGDFARGPLSLRRIGANVALARRLSRELEARALRLVITANGVPLAELGAGARRHPLAWLFGVFGVLLRRRR